MRSLLLVTGLLLSALPAVAQDGEVPPACRPNAQGAIDHKACAAVATPGSPERALSLINLASEAFMDQNFAEAVRLYDEAIPPGTTLSSDVRFHAFRGSAYDHVGRKQEAYRDARASLDMLLGRSTLPAHLQGVRGDLSPVYELILPILRENNDPDFAKALSDYRARPVDDWVGWANRSSVLSDLGDLPAALEASSQALALNASHPAVLNNHCYILARSGNASAALPYCEKAVAGAPDAGAVHHSHAFALALAGKCADAEAALATARRLDPSSATFKEPLACKAQ